MFPAKWQSKLKLIATDTTQMLSGVAPVLLCSHGNITATMVVEARCPGSGQILQPLRGTVCEEDRDFLFLFQLEAVLSSCWKLKGHLTDYVTVSEASYSWECQKWSKIFETNRIYIEKRKPDIYRYSICLYLSWKDILPWSLHVHVDKQCVTFIWLLVKEHMLIKSYPLK